MTDLPFAYINDISGNTNSIPDVGDILRPRPRRSGESGRFNFIPNAIIAFATYLPHTVGFWDFRTAWDLFPAFGLGG